MNPEQYKKLKPAIWKANKWEYIISVLTIVLGMLFQAAVVFTDWPENKNYGKIPGGLTELQFASLFFSLYFIGLYGLWRIQAGYKFVKLNSRLPMQDKREIVSRAFERMNKRAPKITDDSITFQYTGFLWSSFMVTILLDDHNFYINAQSRKDATGGMIDYGMSYRLMRRIRRNIMACLATTAKRL